MQFHLIAVEANKGGTSSVKRFLKKLLAPRDTKASKNYVAMATPM